MCGLRQHPESEHNIISVNSCLADLSWEGGGEGKDNFSMGPFPTPNDHPPWIIAGSWILPASPPKGGQHQSH